MKVYKPTAEEQERARNFTNTDSFDCPKMTKEDLKNCVCFFSDSVYITSRSGRHSDNWMKNRTGHFKCSRLTSSRRDPSAFFYKVGTMKTLSVMIDEAGNFDMRSSANPIYCLTLVFHNQNDSIDDQIKYLEAGLTALGQDSRKAIHTSPLIRREPPYQNMGREELSKLMALVTIFVKKLPIKYKAFIFDKRESDSYNAFLGKMNSEVRMFIHSNLSFFQSFDNIVIYYDRGQKEISDLLKATFEEIFKPNVKMKLAF